MIGDKKALFSAAKKKTIELTVPGTSETVTFNELTVKDRTDYFELQKKVGADMEVLPAFTICRSCPLLSDEDQEAVRDEFSADSLVYFSTEILRLSGMIKGAEEEAEKN